MNLIQNIARGGQMRQGILKVLQMEEEYNGLLGSYFIALVLLISTTRRSLYVERSPMYNTSSLPLS